MAPDRGPGLHEILGGGSQASAASAPATIYIVRHGATKMNNQTDMSEDRIRAWTDVPLVEEGRQEARRAALKLKGKGIQAIVSSDLVRAHETAEIIGKIIGVKIEVSEKLRPWKLGTFTGAPTKEALPKIAEYVRNKPDEAVPEGESFNQFKTRMFDGFADALQAHPEGLLIVTHHRDLQTAEAWEAAGQPPDHSIDLDVFLQKGEPPGAITELKTSLAALKGNGDGMARNDMPVSNSSADMGASAAAPSPRQQFMDRYSQAAQAKKKTDAGADAQAPDQIGGGNMAGVTLAHGRAIAGAKALHAVGHISARERDKHVKASQKAIGQRKPFGAFAP